MEGAEELGTKTGGRRLSVVPACVRVCVCVCVCVCVLVGDGRALG